MSEKRANGFEANGVEAGQALKFTLEEVPAERVSIKVVGIGGCGSNIVDFMLESGLSGVEYVCLNTDKQALDRCNSPTKLVIGQRVTHGYGTGSNPDVGREAALENTEELTELLADADMVFIVVGLGGGTGTGAAPVVGSLAKQMGSLTVAAAVKPYNFEGVRRGRVAADGFAALLEQVDTAIEIPNEHMLGQIDEDAGFFDSFRVANRFATEILVGITDVINKPGVMNSDFADIRMVFEDAGLAVVGSAQAEGPDAASQAARRALAALTVNPGQLMRSKKSLVNITGAATISMHDVKAALDLLHREFDDDIDLIIGTMLDDSIGDQVRIMVVASAFDESDAGADSDSDGGPRAEPLVDDKSFWGSEEGLVMSSGSEADRVSASEPGATAPPEPEPVREPSGYHNSDAEADYGPLPAQQAEPGGYAPPRASQQLPSAGGQLDFMPPPNIRADETEDERTAGRRSPFFRRRSIFR